MGKHDMYTSVLLILPTAASEHYGHISGGIYEIRNIFVVFGGFCIIAILFKCLA
jgi:hypothetical protein